MHSSQQFCMDSRINCWLKQIKIIPRASTTFMRALIDRSKVDLDLLSITPSGYNPLQGLHDPTTSLPFSSA